MGNQNSFVNEQVIQIEGKLENELECLGSKQHKYLGKIQIWRKDSKSNPSIFSKQSNTGSRLDLNLNDHNDRKKVNHPNIIQYYGCQSNYLTFKGNIQQMKFFFEYVPNTLDNIIKFHQKNCSYLEEQEIWKITLQLVSACAFLQKLDLYHGDLNTSSIFIDNNKQVKILYHNAYPDLITSYAKLLAYEDNNVFISPQQLNSYIKQSVTPDDDPYKTDSFQLGLTLLELMTMTSVLEDCIDYQRKTIYYKSIMDLLSSSRKRYSQQLINLVQRLIQFEESLRPTLSDLLFDTNLQQGGQFLPQPKIRRYTSPPKQPERTNSPPPDMGFSSKSPVLRDYSILSQFRTPLQRSVSPILDRSMKFMSPTSRKTTTISQYIKSPNVQQPIIISTQTPIKNDRGRKLNTTNDNSKHVLILSKSPITNNQSRKASIQLSSQQYQPKLKFMLQQSSAQRPPYYAQTVYLDKSQNHIPNQQQFSQTLQNFVQPYQKNQENLESNSQKQNSIPQSKNSDQQQQFQQTQSNAQQNLNQINGKTPQKIQQKGFNLLSPLQSVNK